MSVEACKFQKTFHYLKTAWTVEMDGQLVIVKLYVDLKLRVNLVWNCAVVLVHISHNDIDMNAELLYIVW